MGFAVVIAFLALFMLGFPVVYAILLPSLKNRILLENYFLVRAANFGLSHNKYCYNRARRSNWNRDRHAPRTPGTEQGALQ
jgi:hypothetical protein